jgi:hypothetical protein
MKISKILCICAVLVIFSIGIASAVDIDDFKPPSGFDDGIAESMDKDDFSITIEEYDKDVSSSPFEGDHFNNVTVKDNIGEYTDSFHDEVGAMELVKIGKTHQIVKCKYKDTDSSKISECVKYLKEFNKKNNLTPENIDE